MLEIVGTIVSSILSGGATGLIGVVAQRYADYKNRQLDIQLQAQKYAQELALRDKDAEIMREEWKGRMQVAEVEAEAAESTADSAAFSASYGLEPKQYATGLKPTRGQSWVLVLLDLFRGIIRPALTVYLCALTTMVYLNIEAVMGVKEIWTGTEAIELLKMIVGTILYLTTTCVLWWFGTRNKGVAPK